MAETSNFQMPLLSPSQAQKHVTVNEALSRIDALARLRVQSAVLAVPPSSAADGICYVVAAGASGSWAGHATEVAIRSNGGWAFAMPSIGWTAWNISAQQVLVFDGTSWIANAAQVSDGGAATLAYVREFDHVIAAGAVSTTILAIPSHAAVTAVTARVIAAITGPSIATFSIGVAADAVRYGSGIGKPLNSYSTGITGAPVTYYSDTALVLTPNAGNFTAGQVRFAVHLSEVVPPRAV